MIHSPKCKVIIKINMVTQSGKVGTAQCGSIYTNVLGGKFQNIYIMSEAYFQLLGGLSHLYLLCPVLCLAVCLSVGRFGWPIGLVLLSVFNGLKGVEETFLAIKNFEHVLAMYSFLFPIIQAPRRVYTRYKNRDE